MKIHSRLKNFEALLLPNHEHTIHFSARPTRPKIVAAAHLWLMAGPPQALPQYDCTLGRYSSNPTPRIDFDDSDNLPI
jgi:hypothetical protein